MSEAINSAHVRAEIAVRANAAARDSSKSGAPRLSVDSKLSTLLAWLAWNDANGEYAPEGDEDAFTIGEAWHYINEALS